MIHASPFPDGQIPDVPLVDFVFANAASHADKLALIDGRTGRVVSYGQLDDEIRTVARGLAEGGVRRGDVVAIFGPNSPDYVTAFYGLTMLGACVTTLNPLHNIAELSYQLKDSAANALITTSPATDTVVAAAKHAGIARVFDVHLLARIPSALRPRGDLGSEVDVHRDIATLTYSNVATDVPMGVMLSHYNLVANVAQTWSVEPIQADEVLVGLMPFCQLYGMVTVNLALSAGATIVTLPHFTLPSLMAAMARYQVTTAFLVPAIIRTLTKHAIADEHPLSSLRHVVSLTAPLPEPVGRACAEKFACTVRQAYGLTEAVAFTHFMPRTDPRVTSVGYAVPNTSFRVVDVASGEDVAPGALGEVWVRGPQVMQGYRNYPAVSSQMVDQEGWLHTCDVGYAQQDGMLHIVDRSKKLVRLRGLHRQDREMLRAAVEDIAARRETSDRVRFQAVLLDSVRESIVGTNLDNIVTFWNKGAEHLFGYAADEAIGRAVDSLIFPPGEELRHPEKTVALRTRGTWTSQVMRRRKDGSTCWAEVVVSIVKNADGERSGYIGIHRDITELKRNRDLLEESHDQLRNLAGRLMVVREQERSAIARELHDELGQALTRLNIDLLWLTEQLPQRLKTRRVKSMPALVDRMLQTAQHISSELRPAILDDLGLEAAIESHVHEFAEWSGCRCRLDLRIDALPRHRDRDITVFRILQEALTNVARHARASEVVVSARTSADAFMLEIRDDGIGIVESKMTSPESLGIVGMRERVEGLGGNISIISEVGYGTTIALRVGIAKDLLAVGSEA
jgi:PAS domain S-box-containing protein